MRVSSMRFVPVMAAIMVAAMLLFMGPTTTADADTGSGTAAGRGYVMIGDTKVAKAIGIDTQEELDEFLLSPVPKTGVIDPATGKETLVKLGIDAPDMYINARQAKRVMDGSLTLGKAFAEGAKAAEIRWKRPVSVAKSVTLYQRDGITTMFSQAGSHHDGWPEVTHWGTGGWRSSVEYTYGDAHGSTETRGPGGYFKIMRGKDGGKAVTVTAVHMSR